MRWLSRLLTDEAGEDKLEDKYPTNTFIELYAIWLGGIGTILCILLALSMIGSWLGWF